MLKYFHEAFNWSKVNEVTMIELLGFCSISSNDHPSSVLIRFVGYSSTGDTYRGSWEKIEVCNPRLVPSATST